MKLNNKKIYFNFSSVPNLSSKARIDKKVKNYKKNFFQIMNIFLKYNFLGYEFPFFRFFNKIEDSYKLKKYLLKNNLRYILDCNNRVSLEELKKLIKVAIILDLQFIRIKSSNILSCERYKYKKKWSIKVKNIIKKLINIKPLLKKNNIKIAIENHQDLDSDDLLKIVKTVGPEYVGINFDIGNSFATLEHPLEFFKKIYKFILNIHLKDYNIIKTSSGFKLSRTSLFDGNIGLIKIFSYMKKKKLYYPLSLEIGSYKDRYINVNKKFFFNYFLKKKKKKIFLKKIYKMANKINLSLNTNIKLNEIELLKKSILNLNKLKL